jgi:phage-related protein
MSLNAAMNAVIAAIEGRTDLVKEIFRDPNSDIKSIPEVVYRLQKAIDRNMAKGIRHALMQTLTIQPPENKDKDAFFTGVAAVEEYFDKVATGLENKSD